MKFIIGLIWILAIVATLILTGLFAQLWWVAPLGLVLCGIDGYNAYCAFSSWYNNLKI